jgi:hypothetical protein
VVQLSQNVIEMNIRDSVQNQDLYFNIILNHHVSQKIKWIRNCEFNNLINIIIEKKNDEEDKEHIHHLIIYCKLS